MKVSLPNLVMKNLLVILSKNTINQKGVIMLELHTVFKIANDFVEDARLFHNHMINGMYQELQHHETELLAALSWNSNTGNLTIADDLTLVKDHMLSYQLHIDFEKYNH